ncbi:MAG TPA: HAMP domain-containing protein [Caldithrix abyssi]|uniref:histidine kinase n=1 Tax=Caldithrix abyssi TaxID=187145 RepID=A0A7V5UFC7_CALAY|nr:HAMP domain-containing protein [Caldithrix abyssi]
MKFISLKWKISGLLLFSNVIIGVFLVVFMRFQVYKNLGTELIEKGKIIAQSFAQFAAEQIESRDEIALRQQVSNVTDYEFVEFILIQGSDSTVLADTYNGNVPEKLLKEPIPELEQTAQPKLISLGEDEVNVYEIWAPVEEGYLGYVRVGVRQDYVLRRVRETATKVIGIIIIAITLLWLLIIVIISQKVIKPMTYLTKKADDISKGKLDEEININTHDEIENLGQALERLRESVKIALDRLKKHQSMQI